MKAEICRSSMGISSSTTPTMASVISANTTHTALVRDSFHRSSRSTSGSPR
jgi:hypothetical protein